VQVADTMLGYSLTSAPLVVRDKVIVGVTGGEFGARGFLDAYDAATGKHLWRWYAVPAAGEFGNDTWKGDSWKRGGSPMWLTGSYDPELNLVYWTVGNPASQIDRSSGATSTTCSAIRSLRSIPTPEQRKCYQFAERRTRLGFLPGCSARGPCMARDEAQAAASRRPQRDLYVLDRTNGKFCRGPRSCTPTGERFRRQRTPSRSADQFDPEGSFFVYPTLGGGTNFGALLQPLTGLMYSMRRRRSAIRERTGAVRNRPAIHRPARSGADVDAQVSPAICRDQGDRSGLRQDDVGLQDFQRSLTTGVLATGQCRLRRHRRRQSVALDAKTGKHLWHVQTNSNLSASPMSYAVDGRQFVAIAAGNTVYSFALPRPGR
jgi:alcohol dehydrogenase (cytochrome c)